MPYLMVMASNVGSQVLCGPTYFGDDSMDQELVTELDGHASEGPSEDGTKNKSVDENGHAQMFVTDKTPREVLDILEQRKFKFHSTSTLNEMIIWTLHKEPIKNAGAKKANGASQVQAKKVGTRANSKASETASREGSVASNMEKMSVNGKVTTKKAAASKKAPAKKPVVAASEEEE